MNEQTKTHYKKDIFKGLKVVKSSNPKYPYRLVSRNVDYTPRKLQDRKSKQIKGHIDIADFASLFFTDNFLPETPMFFFNEIPSVVPGVLTGTEYPIISKFAHEKSDKKYLLDKGEKIPEKGIVVEMESLKPIEEPLVEEFKIFLQETETIDIFTRVSEYVDPDPEPFLFYEETADEKCMYHNVIRSIIPETDENEHPNNEPISNEPTDAEKTDAESTNAEPTNIENTDELKIPTEPEREIKLFDSFFERGVSTLPEYNCEKCVGTDKINLKSCTVTASPSDIYDSFNIPPVEEEKNELHDPRECNADYENITTCVLDSPYFNYVYNVIERLLNANYYRKEQILFRYVHLNDDIEKHHGLSTFITLELPKNLRNNKVREVTSLTWHPLNRNLLCVGYGKVHFEKKAKGMICLWNLKIQTIPERTYKFKYPVKSVTFLEEYPYALTVGLLNGHVVILNILAKKLVTICDTFKFYVDILPMTHLAWFKNEEGDYYPVSSSESGEMHLYNLNRDFIPELVLSLPKIEAVKGIEQLTKYKREEDKLDLKAGISTFTQHPTDPLSYLVGTYDGCVHICTLIFKLKSLDVFAAHEGPITSIEFHPHTDKLFLTTGCDYYIRVWGYKIFKPLMSLSARKELIRCAKWYPSNPMLIIAMNDIYIDLWDLRRINNTIPVSTYENVDRTNYLVFNVSPFGPNLMVGDVTGNVYLFIINETRNEPVFTIELLARAIHNHIKDRDKKLRKEFEEQWPVCKIKPTGEFKDILDI